MKNQGFINRFEAGNAFIIILIMIALLTALTLSITRMGNNSSEVSQEQAGVIASQVLRQGRTIANAVDYLLNNGCGISQISFQNTIITNYTNLHSPADKSCWVFDSAGAGAGVPTVPKSANDGSSWIFAMNNSIAGVGPERETTAFCTANCEDLLMALPVVNLDVCKAINKMAGVRTSFSDLPPKDLASASAVDLAVKFQAFITGPVLTNYSMNSASGVYIRTTTTAPINSGELWDKKAACFETPTAGYKNSSGVTVPGTGTYIFYQVLYER